MSDKEQEYYCDPRPPMPLGAVDSARHVLAADVGTSEIEYDKFFAKNPIAVRGRESATFNLRKGPSRSAAFFCDLLESEVTRSPHYEQIIVTGTFDKTPVWVTIDGREDDEIISFKAVIVSSPEVAAKILSLYENAFSEEHEPMAKWWYRGGRGVMERQIYMPRVNQDIRPELYPDLTDPKAYVKRYLDSDASILLMAGPPGTGKTTLLRYMICQHRLYANVVYDETLMQSDALFQSFLFDKNSDLLVIEDADTVLCSREQDQNKMMSRFLNVSDGLIKLPNKKVVFTTNITDFGKVDPALLRPGRCFDVLHTRPLNLTEAQAAAKVCNLPIPTQKQEYTLAELFNRGQGGGKSRQIGFVA